MSELSDALPSADETYRPISGFALAGLLVSGVFAALVLLSAAVGIVLGAPIFYPLWLLLTPVAGFVLSLVGRNQILGSDGTRAGLRLASWGMGLALFSGLGYAAYYLSVGLAVTSQANAFLIADPDGERGFFKHLERGAQSPADVDIAFLLTRRPADRIKIRPGDNDTMRQTYDQSGPDGGPGELSRFRQVPLVRMLARAGDKAQITPLGVRDWSYDKSSYKVARNYQIATPEAVLDYLIQTESAEGEAEGQLRQWSVNLQSSPMLSRKLTPMGQAVEAIREQGQKFVEEEFRNRIRAGKAFADLARADASDWTSLLPDSPEQKKLGKNSLREYYPAQMKALFAPDSPMSFTPPIDPGIWPLWGRDAQGRFWIDVPIRGMIGGSEQMPPATFEGRIRLRTAETFDPATAVPPYPHMHWEPESFTVERIRRM